MSAPNNNTENNQIQSPVYVKLNNNPIYKGDFSKEITIQNPADIVEEFMKHPVFSHGFQSQVQAEIQDEVEEVIIPHVVERVFAVAVPPQPRVVQEFYSDDEDEEDDETEEVVRDKHGNIISAPGHPGRQAGQVSDDTRDELAKLLSTTHTQDKLAVHYKNVDRIEYIDEVIEIPTKIQQDKVICNIIEKEVIVEKVIPKYKEVSVTKKFPVVKIIEKPVHTVEKIPTIIPKEVTVLEGTADHIREIEQPLDYLCDKRANKDIPITYKDEDVYFDRVIETRVPVEKIVFKPDAPITIEQPEVIIVVPRDTVNDIKGEGEDYAIWQEHEGKDVVVEHHTLTDAGRASILSAYRKSVVNHSLMNSPEAEYAARLAPIVASNLDHDPVFQQEAAAYRASMINRQSNVDGNAAGVPVSTINPISLVSRRTFANPPQPRPENSIDGHTHAYSQFVVPMASQIANVHTAYLPAQYAHNVRLSAPEVAHAVMSEDQHTVTIMSKNGPARIAPHVGGGYNAVPFAAHLQGHGESIESQRFPVNPAAALYSGQNIQGYAPQYAQQFQQYAQYQQQQYHQ